MSSLISNLQAQWKTGFQMLKGPFFYYFDNFFMLLQSIDLFHYLARSFDTEESQDLEKRTFYDEILKTVSNKTKNICSFFIFLIMIVTKRKARIKNQKRNSKSS